MNFRESFLLGACLLAITTALKPKMVGKVVVDPTHHLQDNIPPRPGSILKSHNAVFMGVCSPDTPFEFKVGGGTGKGSIGLLTTTGNPILTTKDCIDCIELLAEDTRPNFFGFEASDNGVGFPLVWKDVPAGGATVMMACDVAADVVVILKDENTDVRDDVEAEVTWGKAKNGKWKTLQTISLKKGKKAVKPIKVAAKKNKLKMKTGGQNKGSISSNVAILQAGKTSVSIEHDLAQEVVLLNFEMVDSTGNTVPRTIIMETSDSPSATFNFTISDMNVNNDGDLELKLNGQPVNASYLYEVRIGIVPDGANLVLDQLVDVVDYSAIIDANQDSLVVNGAWIRNAIDDMGVDANNFDIVISEGHAIDPGNGYQAVGKLGSPVFGGTAGQLDLGERRQLSLRPSNEEKGSVTIEMLQGRQAESVGSGNVRRRMQSGNLLLVHGYCGTNPFPTSHFTGATVFSDPSSGSNSWSHDTFALKIDSFTSSMSSCGIVAHSQGGAAALHLYTYYWSCLDNASPKSLIQTVGTPYQGTNLAGVLASLGSIFGAGCGSNVDLTYSGASAWLTNIPSWARAKVTYFTTSFTDKWYRYDYCNLAVDPFLGDPEDGTTERSMGQLPGGTNGGHKEGWCHTSGMRDPAQCTDASRNAQMNTNASR